MRNCHLKKNYDIITIMQLPVLKFSYDTEYSKFQSHSVHQVIHELLENIKRLNNTHHKIDIMIECEHKKHPMIIDSLIYQQNF